MVAEIAKVSRSKDLWTDAMLVWIICFSLLGSVGALVGTALLLAFPAGMRQTLLPCVLSYAIGTLLGTAFLSMIPASATHLPLMDITRTVLAGIVLCFLLERLILWRHCHTGECVIHGQAGPLILIGDALHNFVDGVVIAAAVLTAFPLGVAAALAVIAHEVPQEVGDFAILLVTWRIR
jgi:zinc and cadmium transporter